MVNVKYIGLPGDKMCAAKKEGGMGFRDAEAFNQALLAKQAWRILRAPSSLCARVLKARYFSEGGIMSATCPDGGSYTFRRILHGRDLLRAGLVWRVGDGSRINIHHDQWIPRNGSLTPLGAEYVAGVSKVCHLFDQSGLRWNEQLLDSMFSPQDAADIEQINIGGENVEDYLAWDFTKDGHFTVRSAYHLRISQNRARSGGQGSSSTVNQHKSWMAVRDTSAPGKAKIHMWRLLRNGLAVGHELQRRKIKAGVVCTTCGRDETIYHRFWGCPHSAVFFGKNCNRKRELRWRSHRVSLIPRRQLQDGFLSGSSMQERRSELL